MLQNVSGWAGSVWTWRQFAGRKRGLRLQMMNKMNCWNTVKCYVSVLFGLGCVCLNYTNPMHIFFLEKQHVFPHGLFVGG